MFVQICRTGSPFCNATKLPSVRAKPQSNISRPVWVGMGCYPYFLSELAWFSGLIGLRPTRDAADFQPAGQCFCKNEHSRRSIAAAAYGRECLGCLVVAV